MTINCFSFSILSLYQQPCSPTGYRYEDSIGSAPEICGVTFTDYLVDDEAINRLQLIADNYTELFGETTTTNRESYNLQWINLHSIFRKPHGKGLISDDDYQLLLNVSQAAKVSKLFVNCFVFNYILNH